MISSSPDTTSLGMCFIRAALLFLSDTLHWMIKTNAKTAYQFFCYNTNIGQIKVLQYCVVNDKLNQQFSHHFFNKLNKNSLTSFRASPFLVWLLISAPRSTSSRTSSLRPNIAAMSNADLPSLSLLFKACAGSVAYTLSGSSKSSRSLSTSPLAAISNNSFPILTLSSYYWQFLFTDQQSQKHTADHQQPCSVSRRSITDHCFRNKSTFAMLSRQFFGIAARTTPLSKSLV